jgi:hypothetical protein
LFGVPTLIISEVPLLKLRLLDLEVVGDGCSLAVLSNREGKLLVQRQSNGFGSIGRLVDLETDVEVLASEEVGPVVNCLAQA